MDIMDGNLTQYGMENFNCYNRSNPNFMISKTTKQKVPSGGVNTYAPGSPKPVKDVEQEYEIMTMSNLLKARQDFSGLGISPRQIAKDETLNEQNVTVSTNVDENVKDATIKHLNRHATMLQARVHHLEAIKDKLEATLKEKEQELARANKNIVDLSQANSQLVVQQRNQNVDLAAFENMGDREALWHEVDSLRTENNSLKEREERLINEVVSLRESRFSLEQSQNSNGGLPLMSTQECNKELQSLHQVVDSLKSTVIQQRNYLLKLKGSQTASSSTAELTASPKARAIIVGTANFRDLPRLRQGEEGTASPYPEPSDFAAGDSPKSSKQSKASALAVSGTMSGSSKGLDVSLKNAKESVMRLAGLDVYDQLSAAHSGVFSDKTMEDGDRLNSPLLGSNLMYMNSLSDMPAHPQSNSPKLSNHCFIAKSASPKRDSSSASVAQDTKEHTIQERPVRKISHTEIIRQGPAPNLPVRSKTENLGCNPHRKSQALSDGNIQQRMPSQLNAPATHQPGIAQQRWQEPSMGSSVTKPIPTNLSQTPVPNSFQSSHYNLQHQQWPVYRATSGANDGVIDMGRRQAAAAAERITPDGVSVGMDNIDCALAPSPRERISSDRLCPVCHRDFGSLSIAEFQSHVLECFDNESGPETIVADKPEAQRVCPMCNTSFDDKMPQSEFEKHVHSHFGEDLPGENFELLQP